MRILLLWALAMPLCPHLCSQRVLAIGVDGMSVTGIAKAKAPNLRALMAAGAYTLKARGVMPTVSSPNWASILSGAGPEQHGVTSNDWERNKHEIDPACVGSEDIFPTIFGVLHAANPKLTLAAIYDWDGFGRLFEKSAAAYDKRVLHSAETTEAAIEYWRREHPDFLFVHLDDVDHAGHEKGWETETYMDALEKADGWIGQMAEAVKEDKAFILITADHGGTGTKHGNLNMKELQIPFILAGPGVKAGEIQHAVNNFDVAPTVAGLFKVKPHACWIGKAISAIP